MKKASVCFFIFLLLTSLLCACAPVGQMNILLFTDNLNSINKDEAVSLSNYTLKDGCYKLLFTNEEGCKVLLTLEENEKGEIKKIRLTLSKTDENGKPITLTDKQTEFYIRKVRQALSAFTLFEEEKCKEITEKILPLKSGDFSKTGELTMETENFHLVYYSNKICCQFSAANTFLEKTEATEKPVSKPLYEMTANVSQ